MVTKNKKIKKIGIDELPLPTKFSGTIKKIDLVKTRKLASEVRIILKRADELS